MRDPLIWLGRPDPVEAMGQARRNDPVLARLVAVIEQWSEVDRRGARDRAGIAEIAEAHGEFREALLAVAGEGGKISTGRRGKWLGTVKGYRVNGKHIEEAGHRDGIAFGGPWRHDCVQWRS